MLLIAFARASNNLRLAVVLIGAALCVVQGIFSEGQPTYHLETYGFVLFGVSLALFLSEADFYNTFLQFVKVAAPVALVVCLLVQFWLMPHTHMRGLAVIYALAIGVLIGKLVTSHVIADRLLSTAPLVFVGRISYGIYLVHILCLNVVEKIVNLTMASSPGFLLMQELCFSQSESHTLHTLVSRSR